MQEAYRRILERRRSQIMEQVHWNREFAAGLERHGLLTRDELKEIELELNHKNRVFFVLSKVMSRDEPGIFDRFRRVLNDTGTTNMAESLNFDRQRIQWEFEKPSRVTSVAHYIDLINSELLQTAINEAEDDIRSRKIQEAKRRVDELRNSMRQQQIDRDHLRINLLQAAHSTFTAQQCRELLNEKEHMLVIGNGLTLLEIDNIETRKDEIMVDEITSVFNHLRRSLLRLKADNKMLRDVIASNNIPLPKDTNADADSSGHDDDDEEDGDSSETRKASFHNDTLMELDVEQLTTAGDKYIRFQKAEYDRIVETLKEQIASNIANSLSFMSTDRKNVDYLRSSVSTPILAASTTNHVVSQQDTSLMELVNSVISELQRWKRQSQRLRSEVRRLETQSATVSNSGSGTSHTVHRQLQTEPVSSHEEQTSDEPDQSQQSTNSTYRESAPDTAPVTPTATELLPRSRRISTPNISNVRAHSAATSPPDTARTNRRSTADTKLAERNNNNVLIGKRRTLCASSNSSQSSRSSLDRIRKLSLASNQYVAS